VRFGACLAVVAATVAVTAACGSSGSSSGATYRKQFTSIESPLTTKAKALTAEAKAHPEWTPAQAASAAAGYLAALSTADGQLKTATWPQAAQADVAALLSADTKLATAIRTTTGTAATYQQAVKAAQDADSAAKAKVRDDLGFAKKKS
jgi:hypothetical protein